MRRYLALLPLLLCACKPPEDSHMKVIIGAVMIDGLGGPPVSNSVVVVAAAEIRDAGTSSNVPIPEEADKIDGSGRFLVPGLVDVCPQAEPPAVSQAAFEAARERGKPALAVATTESEIQSLVEKGASGILGMVLDTEDLNSAFLARLRDLHIVFAPSLSTMAPGPQLEVARRNTRRLFSAGVLIAVASRGGDVLREAEALSNAGIPPLDVIVAATRNGALALRQSERQGTIQSGRIANLLLLSANPGEDVRNLRRVAGRFSAGEWSK
jgi:imidazolonepropionase-like amidohydrolase